MAFVLYLLFIDSCNVGLDLLNLCTQMNRRCITDHAVITPHLLVHHKLGVELNLFAVHRDANHDRVLLVLTLFSFSCVTKYAECVPFHTLLFFNCKIIV